MYEIAEQVQRWIADGHDPTLATWWRPAGSARASRARRRPGSTPAAPAGSPLAARVAASADGPGLVEVTLSDDDAASAGLACGGTATVLVQPASAYPDEVWPRLAAREPLCLVTTPRRGPPGDRGVHAGDHPRGHAVRRHRAAAVRPRRDGHSCLEGASGERRGRAVAGADPRRRGRRADRRRAARPGRRCWAGRLDDVEAALRRGERRCTAATPSSCSATTATSTGRRCATALRGRPATSARWARAARRPRGASGSPRTASRRPTRPASTARPGSTSTRTRRPRSRSRSSPRSWPAGPGSTGGALRDASRAGAHRRRPGPAAALLIARRRRKRLSG